MADALLFPLVKTILRNLNSLAVHEFGIAWGLKTELENLGSTLSTIQAVLVDAEAKQWTSGAVNNWLRKLKDLAYDADNVVDEFATEALKRKQDSQRGVRHRVSSFSSLPNRLIFRLKMGHKIKDVKERLDKIAGERNFHLREGLMEAEYRQIEERQTSSILTESEILGRNDEKEMIIDMLLKDLSHTDGVSVCAICGMGGLGKTTLAKLVHNDRTVEKSFDLRMWVCVSDDFNIVRLTRAILESIEGGWCDIANLDPLHRRLQEKLAGSRFLLVLDDVWNEYHEKWDRLKDVLRCGAKGSKVLVTTRKQNVARIMATLPVHFMASLSEDDSWSLFTRRAFGNGRKEDNHELDLIGKAIVKKCGGLPLAINAIGSLMQSKSSESEWLSVKHSEIWDLPDDGRAILPALRLSYDNLPPHSRECFAYCCIFPKHTQMEKDMLIELWMANGFIPSRGETTSHDMGHLIFNDLVWRSLLQDVKENYNGETVCRMHDLMHDLAQSIMRYECYIGDSHKGLKIPEKIRHFFVNIGSSPRVRRNEVVLEVPSLRSLIFYGGTYSSREEICRTISKQKYLRVLHLRYCNELSIAISRFKHLRYLDMSYSYDMKSIPESVCDLQNLETLKLKDCHKLCTLPKRMKQMKNLIYLDIRGCHSLTSMPPKLGQLTSLRRLGVFIVGQDEGCRVAELKELNLGGELTIKQLHNVRNSADAESANLKRKPDLVSLNLYWGYRREEILPKNAEDVLECLQPNSNLKKLTIFFCQVSKFPNWMLGSLLKNLVELYLINCGRCEQLPPLGKLLSLKKLDIDGMISLRCFNSECYGDGEILFKALETLSLSKMPSLEEWTTMNRQDIFPCLGELDIKGCPNLSRLPVLPTLKRLRIGGNEMLLKSVSSLTLLSTLEIGDLQLEILPDGLFQNHKALEFLQLSKMYNLKTLPIQLASLSSLKRLDLDYWPKLENLSGLENLNFLETLGISGCDNLTALLVQGSEGITSLRSLSIERSDQRSLTEDLLHLTALHHLEISRCPNIQSFPEGTPRLDSLQSLSVKDCEGLCTLPNWLGSLQSLSSLWIFDCPNLRSMPAGVQGQKTLRELWISNCPDLVRRCKKESGKDWPNIAHIPRIRINLEYVQYSED